MIDLFQTKRVQTNEVQRASYLYPIFSEISASVKKPLTLIEIGTSAGLLLHLDRYRYDIQQAQSVQFGDGDSPLIIQAQNNGEPLEHVEKLVIKDRIGIDLNVIDLADEAQYEWLQCLIWPELKEQKRNLAIARDIQKRHSTQFFTGDFREVLPELLGHVTDSQVVIFHRHVANQFPTALKEELMQLLKTASAQQTIFHVYNNMYDADLHVDMIECGNVTS